MRSRYIPAAGRLIPVAVLLVACAAPASRGRMADRLAAVLDSVAADSSRLEGPRVVISTDNDVGRYSRVVTRLRVEEDAYVAVVNVSPSGYASVVFPERPDEPALLRGGKTYVMPSQFTGYHIGAAPLGSAGTHYVWYGQSSGARIGARGPGYLFVVASRAPLNLAALEAEGYFDEVDVGGSVHEMEPNEVIPRVAVLASTGAGIAADYARYGGYDPAAYATSMFHSSYNTYCRNDVGMYVQASFWRDAFGGTRCDPMGLERLYRLSRRPAVVATPPAPVDTTADSTDTDGSAKWRRLPVPVPTTPVASDGQGLALHPAAADEVMLTREERRRAIAAARLEAREARAADARTRTREDAWPRPRAERERPEVEGARSRVRDVDAPRHADPAERKRSEPRSAEPSRPERNERRPTESRPVESRPTESRPTAPMKGGGGDPVPTDPSQR